MARVEIERQISFFSFGFACVTEVRHMSHFAYACKTEGKNDISRLIFETA